MNIVGIITMRFGDEVLTVPVVSVPYANLDDRRMPGGLFIDDAGNLGIAVDARASMPSIQASAMESARAAVDAYNAMN